MVTRDRGTALRLMALPIPMKSGVILRAPHHIEGAEPVAHLASSLTKDISRGQWQMVRGSVVDMAPRVYPQMESAVSGIYSY